MAFAPIALTIPQYDSILYKNWWMKAYEQGTTTPLNMATDSGGLTTLVKCPLDTQGFPITSSVGPRFIPFINGDYDLWLFPTEAEADADLTVNAIQLADNLNTDQNASVDVGSYTVANKTAAVLLTPVSGKSLVIESADGGLFKAVTGAAAGTYSDNGGAYCGSQFIPTGGDGSTAWLSTSLFVTAEMHGAVGDKSADDTVAIQSALDSFESPLGGQVLLNPSKRYKVTNITFPDNVVINGQMLIVDQDEGNNFTYDTFYGGILLVSGTITTAGHGSGIVNAAILASHLNGYSVPTNDSEANALVAAFTGTAITASGTGTIYDNLMILGFDKAFDDSGNRHRLSNIRLDCVSGIELGGGSDVSRGFDCHAWPYLTAELGLSTSVNYRSGVAYLQKNNADSFLYSSCYSFGHEVGFRTLGTSGNVVQSPNLINCRADSGGIGASGTSIGFDIGAYTAYPELINPEAQGNDINFNNNTQGADTGSGERLNRTLVNGGKLLEAHDRFCVIDNGRVSFMGTTFGKGSTATAIIDWNTDDGGSVIGCDFEEMAAGSGVPIIDFATAAAERAVQRIGNKQASTIHSDNVFVDNQFDHTREIIKSSGEVTIATGVVTIIGSRHTIDTEADAATDDLDTINGGLDGMRLQLRAADSTRTVIVKDGTGNIDCSGDFSLTAAQDRIILEYDTSLGGGTWCEISRSDNAT